MTAIAQAKNEIREIFTKFLGQRVPEVGPGGYAPFPRGTGPVRITVQEGSG